MFCLWKILYCISQKIKFFIIFLYHFFKIKYFKFASVLDFQKKLDFFVMTQDFLVFIFSFFHFQNFYFKNHFKKKSRLRWLLLKNNIKICLFNWSIIYKLFIDIFSQVSISLYNYINSVFFIVYNRMIFFGALYFILFG